MARCRANTSSTSSASTSVRLLRTLENEHANEMADKLLAYFKKKDKGYLLLNEFLLYIARIAADTPSRAREVLRVFGFGTDLRKAEPSEVTLSAYKEEAQKLPRHILSNNREHIKILFGLLSKIAARRVELRGSVADAVLNLLFRLAASKELFKQVQSLPQTESLASAGVFSSESPYESMYSLFLATSVFFDPSEGEVAQFRDELPLVERGKWMSEFLNKKGFNWALNTLMKLRGKVESGGISFYLIALLNMIEEIVMSSLGSKLKKPFEFYEAKTTKVLPKGPAELINVEKLQLKQDSKALH